MLHIILVIHSMGSLIEGLTCLFWKDLCFRKKILRDHLHDLKSNNTSASQNYCHKPFGLKGYTRTSNKNQNTKQMLNKQLLLCKKLSISLILVIKPNAIHLTKSKKGWVKHEILVGMNSKEVPSFMMMS